MEINFDRNEKILACTTVAVILGFAVLFLHINFRSNSSVSQIENRLQVNYKMARPEEGYSEYSLNGRDIEQTYEGLAKKEIAKAAAGKPGVVAPKPKTEAEKKAEAAKKKNEEAQKAAVAARSQAQSRYAQYTADQARKKAQAEQQAKSNSQVADGSSKSSSQAESQNYESRAVMANEQNPSTTEPTDKAQDKNKNKKTYAQWRTQIFSQPTRENISSFLEAYRKGEISTTEVQAMAQDLLDQNDDNLKGLGLYTLRSTPSLASLSQLVHAEAQMNSTYKAYIEQAFLAYLQPQNVGYLNQALQTKDKTLISKTLSILNTNLPNVAKGNNAAFADPRGGREAGAGSNITMSSFVSLLPALNTLVSSQDQDYTSLAHQVMGYIQSSNSIAQN